MLVIFMQTWMAAPPTCCTAYWQSAKRSFLVFLFNRWACYLWKHEGKRVQRPRRLSQNSNIQLQEGVLKSTGYIPLSKCFCERLILTDLVNTSPLIWSAFCVSVVCLEPSQWHYPNWSPSVYVWTPGKMLSLQLFRGSGGTNVCFPPLLPSLPPFCPLSFFLSHYRKVWRRESY